MDSKKTPIKNIECRYWRRSVGFLSLLMLIMLQGCSCNQSVHKLNSLDINRALTLLPPISAEIMHSQIRDILASSSLENYTRVAGREISRHGGIRSLYLYEHMILPFGIYDGKTELWSRNLSKHEVERDLAGVKRGILIIYETDSGVGFVTNLSLSASGNGIPFVRGIDTTISWCYVPRDKNKTILPIGAANETAPIDTATQMFIGTSSLTVGRSSDESNLDRLTYLSDNVVFTHIIINYDPLRVFESWRYSSMDRIWSELNEWERGDRKRGHDS